MHTLQYLACIYIANRSLSPYGNNIYTWSRSMDASGAKYQRNLFSTGHRRLWKSCRSQLEVAQTIQWIRKGSHMHYTADLVWDMQPPALYGRFGLGYAATGTIQQIWFGICSHTHYMADMGYDLVSGFVVTQTYTQERCSMYFYTN